VRSCSFFSLGTFGRALGVLLLLAGIGCAGYGGWAHFSSPGDHLVTVYAGIDPMPVLTSYLGIFLAGAMFLALGTLVSSLVKSQMIAALISLVLSLVFIVVGFWRPDLDSAGTLYQVLYFFSVPLHFSRDFSRGLIDTRHLILYATVALLCLFLTVRSLESRRWR
jgi:ABC-2 type transport system permease protein